MPALSSTMTEGKIVSWLKSPGDKISKGESVVVVESDKADMDVESFSEGWLGGIVIDEGGVASVGAFQIIGNLARLDLSIPQRTKLLKSTQRPNYALRLRLHRQRTPCLGFASAHGTAPLPHSDHPQRHSRRWAPAETLGILQPCA